MPIQVNGELVDDAVVRQEIVSLRPRYQEVARGMDPAKAEAQLRQWARENVIERVLLRQEALKDTGPLPPEELQAAIGNGESEAEAEARLRVTRLVGRITGKLARPRRKDMVEYYRKNKERFWSEETVHASHIVKHVDENNTEEAARAGIEAALADLRNGLSFAEAAERHSDCKGSGGDLGLIQRGQMVEEFEAVVFGMGENGVSEIFRTVFGFHIAKTIAKHPAAMLSFEAVEPQLEQMLFNEKRERALEGFVDRLKAKAVIL